jgi:hypothetical protein
MFAKLQNAIVGIAISVAAVANPGTGLAGGLAIHGRVVGHPTIVGHYAPGPQTSFNLQYLQLQSAIQNENRQFTMVSNIMKKRDAARNAIDNIR